MTLFVKMAINSLLSFPMGSNSIAGNAPNLSIILSQTCVSLSSFRQMRILWMKSWRDSAD